MGKNELFDSTNVEQHMRLLRSVAEQLKLPLVTMARQAELAAMDGTVAVDPEMIRVQSDVALKLLDSYLLGLQLIEQEQLNLEPVSVSSTLTDVAHTMSGFAKQYGVDVELHIAGRYGPVMAHQKALHAALLNVGYSLAAQPLVTEQKRLVLAAHRTPAGIVAGTYANAHIPVEAWRHALELQGKAAQPFTTFSGAAAGMFVADALGQVMSTRLRVGRFAHKTGLAMTLQPSRQLQLV